MLERYRDEIDGLPDDVRVALAEYFGFTPAVGRRWSVVDGLDLLGLCQADVVLALLRVERLPVGEFCGCRVTRCPPALRGSAPSPRRDDRRAPDQRRVVSVVRDNPRQTRTPAWHRWRVVRVGRTVQQMLARGLTRKDLRIAVRHQWIQLEEIGQ